jgi:hypothetical protein
MGTSEPPTGRAFLDVLFLTRSLTLLRGRMARTVAASTAILYALGSMLLGGMLALGPTGWHTTFVQFETDPYSPYWWNFPALVMVAPGGVLVLPFFATLAMIVVSIGVGIGMTVGLVLAYRVIRGRRRSLSGPATASTAAGLTPAMIALVTLGACCSTAAAATAGVGVVAEASGTTATQLLAANWFLGVFQMVVLWVALVAQEQLLGVFQGFLPRAGRSSGEEDHPAHATALRARLVSISLRLVLLVGGVTWALAMFAEWIVTPPGQAGAGTWTWWIVEHQVPALFAIFTALASPRLLETLRREVLRPRAWALRGVLAISGVMLIGWLPASIASAGPHGLVNEALGVAGLPVSWGAVPLPGIGGLSLVLRWVFQLGALAGFALAFAIWPSRALEIVSPTAPLRVGPPDPTRPGAGTTGPVAAGSEGPSTEEGGTSNAPPVGVAG